jgi:hypothetical protein
VQLSLVTTIEARRNSTMIGHPSAVTNNHASGPRLDQNA